MLTTLQIERAGRWDSSAMSCAYLTRLPAQFLRTMAGFHSDVKNLDVNGSGLSEIHLHPPNSSWIST